MFNKFCFFKVTAWITFILFKAALRSRVKLAPSEQALLFKSKRCSNVLAILSHSCFPHGAPAQAAPRSCGWTLWLAWSQLTEREKGGAPSAWLPWKKHTETSADVQNMGLETCEGPLVAALPGHQETQRTLGPVFGSSTAPPWAGS